MQLTAPLFRRLRRLALTTKMVNGGYYKGTGSGSMGEHTKHGGYNINYAKVRTYVVPEGLRDFKVGPIISPPNSLELGQAMGVLKKKLIHGSCNTVDTVRHKEHAATERRLRGRSEGWAKWGEVPGEVEEGEWDGLSGRME